MKTISSFILALFLLGITKVYSQTINNRIVIGTVDSIYSKVLNENRKIWVYLPNPADTTGKNKQRYPVAYLLDGDAHFASVTGMIQQLSQVNGNTACPEMIVVGILNTDRTRDLTPTHASVGYDGDSTSVLNSGGGERFFSFLEGELIPHIDSLYPSAPYRMFIGHSYGGLTVLNTLINHTNLFNAYVALDPSLWWDNQRLLKHTQKGLHEKRFDNKFLYLAVANTMMPGLDTSQVNEDTHYTSLHIRSIFHFVQALKSNAGNGLKWNWKYYNEDDHGSVPLIGEYDAIRFIFSDFKMPLTAIVNDSTLSADSLVLTHFKNVSKQMGYEVSPPETVINSLGYVFLAKKMFSKAFSFFEMNIRNYPNSLNVFDSMGDYYAAKGDKQKAIECYTKAYSVNRLDETKMKLERLRSSK